MKQEKTFLSKSKIAIFKYVKKHTKNNQEIPAIKTFSNYTNDTKVKCEIFADYFQKSFSNTQ